MKEKRNVREDKNVSEVLNDNKKSKKEDAEKVDDMVNDYVEDYFSSNKGIYMVIKAMDYLSKFSVIVSLVSLLLLVPNYFVSFTSNFYLISSTAIGFIFYLVFFVGAVRLYSRVLKKAQNKKREEYRNERISGF